MKVEDFIFKAGTATSEPPPPEGGIPRQWLPFWIRQSLRIFFLPFVLFDLAMQKVAKLLIPPPYKQAGKCKRRGNCCHYILIRKPKGILGGLFTFWNTQVHGFYLRSNETYEYEKHRVMMMGCRHLQSDGSCGSYTLRPMVCRKWPVIEAFGIPRILKGCGFIATPRTKKKLHIAED